jgi:tetratricopeptide (TPR) repeat protein
MIKPENLMCPKKEITAEAVVKLLINSALVAKLLIDYPDAESRLIRAAALAETVGQAEMKNRVLAEKAALYYLWGRFDEGLELTRQVISSEVVGNYENRASAWNTSGNIHLRRCSFSLAEESFLQALEHYQKLGMDTSVGIVRNNLANIHNIQGNYPRALELYRQALDCFERQNDIYRTAHVLHSMSQILMAQKDIIQAKAFLMRSLALREQVNDYRGIVNNLLTQVGLQAGEREFDKAQEFLQKADQIISGHGLTDPHLVTYRHGEAGTLYFLAGQYEKAEECLLRLIEISEKMKMMSFLSGGYSWLGKNRVFRDNNDAGISHIKKGLALAESSDLPYEFKNALGCLVECYCRLGNKPLTEQAARDYAGEAIKQGDSRETVDAEIARLLSGK